MTALRDNVLKLDRSPFYAKGGGQIADAGVIACEHGDCRARVVDVVRSGDDQAVIVEVEEGELHEGEKVIARVDRAARHATEANHTATHLLHAALRERLGTHVRQAGSYVGPDKLRFDFTHSAALTPEELRDVEDRVNEWILRNDLVLPQQTTLEERPCERRDGAVRREVRRRRADGRDRRRLATRASCAAARTCARRPRSALFKVTTETSSAANVRRIEALTGPEAVALHARAATGCCARSRRRCATEPSEVPDAVLDAAGAGQAGAEGGRRRRRVDEGALGGPRRAGRRRARARRAGRGVDAKALMDVADRVKGRLGDSAAIVLGSVGRAAACTSSRRSRRRSVERGVKAGEIVKVAAQIAGGGGGGRDTMAQAGGKDPAKLDEALAAARGAIEAAAC